MRIPEDTGEFAINASNVRHWEPPVQRYVDELLAGRTGPRGRDFNMRWVASMVADVHRIMSRGGIFMYPRDARDPGKPGRLRLLYEGNPMAFLVEQAGGAATNGHQRILEVLPVEAARAGRGVPRLEERGRPRHVLPPRMSATRRVPSAVLVALQFGLIVALVAAVRAGRCPQRAWPLTLFLLATAIVLGVWTLGHNRLGNFNIRPELRSGARLVTGGPYRWIRHPMYMSVLLGVGALRRTPIRGRGASRCSSPCWSC